MGAGSEATSACPHAVGARISAAAFRNLPAAGANAQLPTRNSTDTTAIRPPQCRRLCEPLAATRVERPVPIGCKPARFRCISQAALRKAHPHEPRCGMRIRTAASRNARPHEPHCGTARFCSFHSTCSRACRPPRAPLWDMWPSYASGRKGTAGGSRHRGAGGRMDGRMGGRIRCPPARFSAILAQFALHNTDIANFITHLNSLLSILFHFAFICVINPQP
jgi:hypothetical protein